VVLFLSNGEAREQRVADEVAPAPEHRGDPHPSPVPEGGVETAGGPGSPALERAPRLAPTAKSTDATGHWRVSHEPASNRRWPDIGTGGAFLPDLRVREARAIPHPPPVRAGLPAQGLPSVRPPVTAERRPRPQLLHP